MVRVSDIFACWGGVGSIYCLVARSRVLKPFREEKCLSTTEVEQLLFQLSSFSHLSRVLTEIPAPIWYFYEMIMI